MKMRIKFEIDADNNVNILDADQEENTIVITQNGDTKVVLVSTPDASIDSMIRETDYEQEAEA